MSDDLRVPGRGMSPTGGAEPGLGELLKALAQDTATLVRQEVNLAKLELSQVAANVGKGVAMLAIGGSLLLVGLLVLVAFLVILLGDVFDNYWLGALIIGLVFLVIGALIALSARKKLSTGLAPTQTLATLRDDKQWVQQEAQQVRRDLTS